MQVLYPHAHGKGLGLHMNAAGKQLFVSVAGAVTDGEHGGGAIERAALFSFEFERRQLARARRNVAHARIKIKLAAERDYLVSQRRHDRGQNVCADMRLALRGERFAAAVTGKFGDDRRRQRTAYARAQLSVRKSPRAALSELHVAFFFELSAVEKGVHLFHALFDLSSALDDEGTRAEISERERAEKPRGTAPHHGHANAGERLLRQGHSPSFKFLKKRERGRVDKPDIFVAARPNNSLFTSVHENAEGIDRLDKRLFSAIERAFEQLYLPDLSAGYFEQRRRSFFKVDMLAEALFYAVYPDHFMLFAMSSAAASAPAHAQCRL